MNPKINKGFTLIEIMLVVIIIGVLTAMVVPKLAGRGEQARAAAAKLDIEANYAMALEAYRMDMGRFPTTEQGLSALIEKPSESADKWQGPYLKRKKDVKDPWGNDYIYLAPGEENPDEYDLSSYGKDGVNSQDDITNWGEEVSQ